MVARAGVAAGALFLLLIPEDVFAELFLTDRVQVDFARLVAGVATIWAVGEAWTHWRGIPVSKAWSLVGITGVATFAFSLVASMPTLVFFSFPMLVGSTLSTLMEVAESWRTVVLTRETRRRD